MAVKILKNNTASPVSVKDVGVTIAASSSYTIPQQDYLLWAASSNVLTLISAGTIIVNDGLRDLSSLYGAYFIKYPDEAFHLRFLSGTDRANGFVSKTCQEAIEEAKSGAEGKMRYLASCGFDGTATTGRYLEYNSNVDSNLSGFVIALASYLRELTISVVSNATTTFKVYTRNGTTETEVASISLSNARIGSVTGLSVSLPALSEIRIKCTSGSSARPIVFQYYQVQ